MPASPSEQYRELTNTLSTLTERVDGARDDVNDLWGETEKIAGQLLGAREEIARLREELGHARRQLEEERAVGREQERALAELRQQTALLTQRLDDHIKRVEIWDGRRWGLIVVLVGAVFSLASGLIVTLARK